MLKQIFQGKSNSTLVQLIRYFFVGGLAFVVDYGVFSLLRIWLGVHYLWANIWGFVFGLLVNYLLSLVWVFSQRDVKDSRVEFVLFAVVGLLGLGLNELVIWACTEAGGLHPQISKLISTAAVFFSNFFGRKLLLFRGARAQEGGGE